MNSFNFANTTAILIRYI